MLCRDLEEVSIPSIQSIESDTFSYCNKLKRVFISESTPATVISVLDNLVATFNKDLVVTKGVK